MPCASAASSAPASSASLICSGVSTTLFSGVCWFTLFSSASVACAGGASGSSAASSGVSGSRVGRSVSCASCVCAAAAVSGSSGWAASASGAPSEKVSASASAAAVPLTVHFFQNVFFMLCSQTSSISRTPPRKKRTAFHFSVTLPVYTRGQGRVNCRARGRAVFFAAHPAPEKCSKRNTSRARKSLHKAKNCRYFQQKCGFHLLS